MSQVISVANREVTVNRVSSLAERKVSERPVISLSLVQPEPSRVYKQGETVEMIGVLQHLDISHGEGRHNNTKLRLIYPDWLSYVDGSDTCKTNYTSGSAQDCQVVINHRGTPDIMFSEGIMFSDVISINLTLSVDPNDEMEKGKGDVHSMVVGYVLCQHSTFHGWPSSNEQCGPFSGMKVTVPSAACSAPLQLGTACLSSSSALEDSNLPANVLTDDDAYWAPAIRTGPNWEHYIEIFMRRRVALNRIKLYEADSAVTRKPIGVKVFVSLDGFTYIEAKHSGSFIRHSK